MLKNESFDKNRAKGNTLTKDVQDEYPIENQSECITVGTALERKVYAVLAKTPLLKKMRFVTSCASFLCAIICLPGIRFGFLLVLASLALIVIHIRDEPITAKVSIIPMALFSIRFILDGTLMWNAVFYGTIMQCLTYILVVLYGLYVFRLISSFKANSEVITGLFIIEVLYAFGCIFRGLISSMLGFVFGLYCFAFMGDYLVGLYDAGISVFLVFLNKILKKLKFHIRHT